MLQCEHCESHHLVDDLKIHTELSNAADIPHFKALLDSVPGFVDFELRLDYQRVCSQYSPVLHSYWESQLIHQALAANQSPHILSMLQEAMARQEFSFTSTNEAHSAATRYNETHSAVTRYNKAQSAATRYISQGLNTLTMPLFRVAQLLFPDLPSASYPVLANFITTTHKQALQSEQAARGQLDKLLASMIKAQRSLNVIEADCKNILVAIEPVAKRYQSIFSDYIKTVVESLDLKLQYTQSPCI